MEIIFHPYTLELKHSFTITRKSINTQPSLIIELKMGNISGFGEATANPYYNSTIEKLISDIEKKKDLIESLAKETPEIFWNKVYPHFSSNMFALCALDNAFNDLHARIKQLKLYQLWGLSINNNVKTNYTIGIDTVENMVLKLKEKPWPIYKIKLGTKDDIKIVQELRKHTNSIFRVDANCGWTVNETINNSKKLKELGVEFIEQPLKADDFEGAKKVFENTHLPIIADESCIIESDVEKCYQHFHGVNVKLMKCGGITPARRMLNKAKQLKMKTMVGCMTESTVGVSSIAHLLPLLDFVDMDGPLLLKNKIAMGVKLEKGEIIYPTEFGNGSSLIK